jgi:type IV pilus biogenesis protein CpaD/CtpE
MVRLILLAAALAALAACASREADYWGAISNHVGQEQRR